MTDVLELGFPRMRYDITLPLLEGRVEIPGIQLKPETVTSMISGDSPRLRTGDFGLQDLNLGYLLPAIEAGWEIVALPVFSKRKPAYQFIFCRVDAGIASPKDLEGKRIGARTYRTALTIWTRGLLGERHGVNIRNLRWVVSAPEFFPVHDRESKIEQAAEPNKSPVQCLLDGEVDAIMTDISDAGLFKTLETDARVRRLFPDYESEDLRLYREMGIYTPVHVVIMSRALDRERPELASQLYEAFQRSKQLAEEDILSDRAGFSVVYLRERMKEQMERWSDPFKYGISANRAAIETFIRYNAEQGMTSKILRCEDVFPRSLLDT